MRVEISRKWNIDGHKIKNPNEVLEFVIDSFLEDFLEEYFEGKFIYDKRETAKLAVYATGPIMEELQTLIEYSGMTHLDLSGLRSGLETFMEILHDHANVELYDTYVDLIGEIAQMWE